MKEVFMNHHNHEAKNLDNSFTDPVCGMAVTKASKFHERLNGKTYFFCSEKCQIRFNTKPELYLTKQDETKISLYTTKIDNSLK